MRSNLMKWLLCMLLLPALLFTGCRAGDPAAGIPAEAGVMLVDCYRAVRATVDGDGYDEFVLYTGEDPSVLHLEEYHGDADGEESMTAYAVPVEAAQQCYAYIKKAGFRNWEKLKNPVSVDGLRLVCKFRSGETYIRVSSDAMPENGGEALEEIFYLLGAYARDEYLIL